MDAEVAPEVPPAVVPDEVRPPTTSFRVQLIVHTLRISGEIIAGGVPQRMTDFLNNHDENVLFVYNGEIDDVQRDAPPRSFKVAQVRMDTILLAAPRAGLPASSDPFERVQKVAVPVSLALPGLHLTGKVYMLPDADLARVPIAGRRFAPLTEVTVTPAGAPGRAWQEPVVAFNIARALVYAAA